MKNLYIGCSGFYYKGWREHFYPKGVPMRKWFEYYCEHFNTVELNVTFYRFPKLEALQGWYARSPQGFKFTVKAWRLITHYKRFTNTQREVREFYDIVASGLQDKLGCILFQLHPSLQYTPDNLDRIVSSLDPSFNNVIEFRHASWWRQEVCDHLREHHLSFCGISYPGLPSDVMATAPLLYFRFHGVPKLYLSSYTDGELSTIASAVESHTEVEDVYAYFNNDIEVAAVHNAKRLAQMMHLVKAL